MPTLSIWEIRVRGSPNHIKQLKCQLILGKAKQVKRKWMHLFWCTCPQRHTYSSVRFGLQWGEAACSVFLFYKVRIGYILIKMVEKHRFPPLLPLSDKWHLEDSNSVHSLESIFFSQDLPGKRKPFEKDPVKDFSSLNFYTLYTNCPQLKHSNGNLWDYIKL